MSIDLQAEQIISLSEAARTMPAGPVHVSTVHRWRLRGIKNIKLETCLCGGKRVTSREAIERFFARTTAAADGQSVESSPSCSNEQREQAIAKAERDLAAEGI